MEKNASYCIFCGSPNSIASGPTSFCKPEDQIGHLWAASSLGAPVSNRYCDRHRQTLPMTRQLATVRYTASNLPRQHFCMTPPATSQDSISAWVSGHTADRLERRPTTQLKCPIWSSGLVTLILHQLEGPLLPEISHEPRDPHLWVPGPTYCGSRTFLWVPSLWVPTSYES